MLQYTKKKIFAYFISLLLFMLTKGASGQEAENDTVDYRLFVRGGFDLVGPGVYAASPDMLNTMGYFSYDINEKYAIYAGFGYSKFRYAQYNYEYLSSGLTMKTGIDINIMRPQNSGGRYWAGAGIRYGISSFDWEVPSYEYSGYWGTISSEIRKEHAWGHYLELAPGFRAEVFKNFTMGWSIPLRRLIYSGTGNDLRPVHMPGFGAGSSKVSAGIEYYLSWNIPLKTIRVKARVHITEDAEGTAEQPAATPASPQQPGQQGRTNIMR